MLYVGTAVFLFAIIPIYSLGPSKFCAKLIPGVYFSEGMRAEA
jgi:hypothetical protein